MKIEITKAFGPYSVGAVLTDVPPNRARAWIDRNVARELPADVVAERTDRQMKAADYDTRTRPGKSRR